MLGLKLIHVIKSGHVWLINTNIKNENIAISVWDIAMVTMNMRVICSHDCYFSKSVQNYRLKYMSTIPLIRKNFAAVSVLTLKISGKIRYRPLVRWDIHFVIIIVVFLIIYSYSVHSLYRHQFALLWDVLSHSNCISIPPSCLLCSMQYRVIMDLFNVRLIMLLLVAVSVILILSFYCEQDYEYRHY